MTANLDERKRKIVKEIHDKATKTREESESILKACESCENGQISFEELEKRVSKAALSFGIGGLGG